MRQVMLAGIVGGTAVILTLFLFQLQTASSAPMATTRKRRFTTQLAG